MNAVEVSYKIEGSGPALYMVHGIGSRKVTWDGIVPALKAHFTCVTYDLRGHGDSPIDSTPYSLDDMVADLEALREKLGHEAIHVIGHSLGGMIGPAYARAYPNRTLSVGLLSTAAGRTDDDSTKLRNVIDLMEDKGVMPVIRTLVERWYTDEFIAARPDLIDMRMKQVEDTPEHVFLSVFRIYGTTEMAPWLNEVNCPCLVLTGELDGGCNPRLNRFIDEQLPDSELVILNGLKHSILIEAPQRVVEPLKAFLLKVRG
ncbi:MAG: alpha/beta fold hydrolase [Gammaproteobacteria bacterium]|nr:alpha/beta fold hydrolase [Gammaproteobacteria bacterium]